MKLSITGADKKPVSTASVDLRLKDAIIRSYPDAGGKLDVLLPVGQWKVSVSDIGREGEKSSRVVKDLLA